MRQLFSSLDRFVHARGFDFDHVPTLAGSDADRMKLHGVVVALDRLCSLTASLRRLFGVRQQPESVRSRPGRLLLVLFSCQQLAVCAGGSSGAAVPSLER